MEQAKGSELAAVLTLTRPHLYWLVDHEVGFEVLCSLIVWRDKQALAFFARLAKSMPVQLFVKKHRKIVFITYLLCFDPLPANGGKPLDFDNMFVAILKKKSNLRYILKRELSCWIFLLTVCRATNVKRDTLNKLREKFRTLEPSEQACAVVSDLSAALSLIAAASSPAACFDQPPVWRRPHAHQKDIDGLSRERCI